MRRIKRLCDECKMIICIYIYIKWIENHSNVKWRIYMVFVVLYFYGFKKIQII